MVVPDEINCSHAPVPLSNGPEKQGSGEILSSMAKFSAAHLVILED